MKAITIKISLETRNSFENPQVIVPAEVIFAVLMGAITEKTIHTAKRTVMLRSIS